MNTEHSHFKGKDALGHVAEAQAKGMIASTEIHGTEPPGHLAAFADSARDMSIVLLLVYSLIQHLILPFTTQIIFLIAIALGWAAWKVGRSAWLAWSRLERLHRLLSQEKYEIEHHRQQEREELGVLYAAKGFEGKLLEDVLDVLMADGDRLLKVMVEEELGLTLENQEHPLRQSAGAALGSLAAALLCIGSLFFMPWIGMILSTMLIVGAASALLAHLYGNHLVPALVWNIGLAILSLGILYYLTEYLFKIS